MRIDERHAIKERRALASAVTMGGIMYQADIGKKIISSLLRQGYIERIWPSTYRVTAAGRVAAKDAA